MEPSVDALPAADRFDGIRAVLFDVDGTLYRQAPMRRFMALELLTLPVRAPLAAPRKLRAIRAFRAAQEALRQDGKIDAVQRQVETAAEASGLSVAEIEAVVTEWMMRRPLKYLQFCRAAGLADLLTAIGRRGWQAGVLSDYPAEAKLRALGMEGRFWPVLSASDPDIGTFKPHPRGFLRACELWGLSPRQVLYVGDRPEVDATGAAAAGMPCVIMGGPDHGVPGAHGYVTFSSFERLTRVLDGR